ncbi:hypothetical protein J6590_057577 [Homalodisca vitripennis]|nr:hypothetical protein J6590_057577 [Homalodisca vitripennis]
MQNHDKSECLQQKTATNMRSLCVYKQPRTTTTDVTLPLSVLVTATTLTAPPAYTTPTPTTLPGSAFTSLSSLEDHDQIHILRKKLEHLEVEYQKLLKHTIESDSLLLQFTGHIFPVNISTRVDLTDRVSAQTVKLHQQTMSNLSNLPSYRSDPLPSGVMKLTALGTECDMCNPEPRYSTSYHLICTLTAMQGADRRAGTNGLALLLATLPQRHDLDLDHPVLVNALMEKLIPRYNAWLLKPNGVDRGYFTRHAQHLPMRDTIHLKTIDVNFFKPCNTQPLIQPTLPASC